MLCCVRARHREPSSADYAPRTRVSSHSSPAGSRSAFSSGAKREDAHHLPRPPQSRGGGKLPRPSDRGSGHGAAARGINTREHANGGDGPPHGGRRALGRCASGTEEGRPSAPGVVAPQSALVSSAGCWVFHCAALSRRLLGLPLCGLLGLPLCGLLGLPLCGAVGTAAAARLWAAEVQRDARRSNRELLLGGLARMLLIAVRAGGDALLRR